MRMMSRPRTIFSEEKFRRFKINSKENLYIDLSLWWAQTKVSHSGIIDSSVYLSAEMNISPVNVFSYLFRHYPGTHIREHSSSTSLHIAHLRM